MAGASFILPLVSLTPVRALLPASRGERSVYFKPNIRRVTGRTFKSALAQVWSSLDYPDKPHWFTARRAARSVGDKHH